MSHFPCSCDCCMGLKRNRRRQDHFLDGAVAAALKKEIDTKWRPVLERFVRAYKYLQTGTWPPSMSKWAEMDYAYDDAKELLKKE